MDATAFTPLLATTDWNEEWQRLQIAREHADDAAIWDEKAKTFPVKHGSQEGYVARFLELACIQPDEAVLDMGCGTGALATPLAQAGNRVIACDFSQGMLDVMIEDQANLGVCGVEARIMSWEDDWEACGLTPGSVDVALASRSIATSNLKEALMKLDRVARRRVCITLPSGPSPKSDLQLLAAAGFEGRMGRDFLYAFNILAHCGIMPEVAYIPNTRLEVFASEEDALRCFSGIVRDAVKGMASEKELEAVPTRLAPWLHDNLLQDESGFHLKMERNVTWAFIAWNKE